MDDVAQQSGWGCEVAVFTFYMVDCSPNRPKGKTPDTDQDPKPEEPKITLTWQNHKRKIDFDSWMDVLCHWSIPLHTRMIRVEAWKKEDVPRYAFGIARQKTGN